MSGAAFEAYTKGRTLFFGRDGRAYGAERYLEGRRVQWSFLDGECLNGVWYDEGSLICFIYEDDPSPHCWTFTPGNAGLIAELQGDGEQSTLYEAQELGDEMVCLGPKVGV